ALHGLHHVAQKFTTTTLPARDSGGNALFWVSTKVSFGRQPFEVSLHAAAAGRAPTWTPFSLTDDIWTIKKITMPRVAATMPPIRVRVNMQGPPLGSGSRVARYRKRNSDGARSSGGVKPRSSMHVAVTLASPAPSARAGSIS